MTTTAKPISALEKSNGRFQSTNRKQPESIYGALWEYIPLSQYSRPLAPAREVVRSSLSLLWRQLHPVALTTQIHRKKLGSLPSYLLNHAVQLPDVEPMTNALRDILNDWQHTRESWSPVRVIVGPPGSYVDQLVTSLALQNGWRVLGAPSVSEILSGGDAWLENVKGGELVPLVIPRLGQCYLRHQRGLELISRLFDWLRTTKRRCLIACDSWAWAYLVNALRIDILLPGPFTLSPLDAARLQFWLPSLAFTNKGRFVFRDASNGQLIFPMADSYDECLKQNAQPGQMEMYGKWIGGSNFLRQLAAYGRGQPQIIWSLWRECLQIADDTRLNAIREKVGASEWYTVWVKPWSQLELPLVPGTMRTKESMMLHTLLLHGGASTELLSILLPFSPNDVQCILFQLKEARLAKSNKDKRWSVTSLGYPAVRRLLENEGYLVDAF